MNDRDAEIASLALALLNSRATTPMMVRKALLSIRANSHQDLLSERLLEALSISRSTISDAQGSATRTIEQGLSRGIVPLAISSDAYPALLRKIDDAPPLIYFRGHQSALRLAPCVSVIGTRKATEKGLLIAERLATYLGEEGIAVVSGLALGIDAAAHRGALLSPTPTITVLAHGLESASPKSNAGLADEILDRGGVWVSEHPFRTPAKPEYFVRRNRIQVGLSVASVVVEGEEKSGSMTHAEFCIQNKRKLFAVLPDPSVFTSRALPQKLVSDRGATPIRSKEDYPDLVRTALEQVGASV